ncbi:MAG: hypothetical protein ABL995_08905 [Bryobacteraceae bacterium]
MKRMLAIFAFSFATVFGQTDALTNDTIIKMVQAGVPTATIINTIAAAARVDFKFIGPELQRLTDAKVPDDVFKAMAAKDKGRPVPGSMPLAAPSEVAPNTQPATATQSAPIAPPPTTAPSTKHVGLKEVQKIYIDKLDNNLDQYLRAEFFKQMKGKVSIVTVESDADAVLTGVSDEEKGTGAKITGRYLGLHDIATGSLSLLTGDRKEILWADEAGDRSLFFSIAHRGGERKVAERLVEKLKKAMGR